MNPNDYMKVFLKYEGKLAKKNNNRRLTPLPLPVEEFAILFIFFWCITLDDISENREQ